MKDTILVLTNNGDESVDGVIEQLKVMGEKYFRFNTEMFPLGIKLKLTTEGGFIENESVNEIIDLNSIKSVWYRRPEGALITNSGLGEGYIQFIKNESKIALWSLYTTLDAFWVNPPLYGSQLLQRNKLLQLKDASSIGLKIPDTLITNDPDELVDFCKANGNVMAVKLLRGNWFVEEGSNIPLSVFTQRISLDDVLKNREDIKLAPILAQEYVEKDLELRITIVGGKIFACAIHSQDSEQTKTDWRNYDLMNVRHEPYQLPLEIENKLFTLMNQWYLNFGALDMILTPSGEYVFLEINPNGQWLWIEQLTDMPISKSLAEILANPLT